MKKYITAAMAALYLLTVNPVHAEEKEEPKQEQVESKPQSPSLNLEALIGNKRVDLDMIVKANVIPEEYSGGVNLVIRDLAKVDYDGNTSNFLLARAEFVNHKGFSLGIEGQKADNFDFLRAAAVYKGTAGPFFYFAEAATDQDLNWEGTAIAALSLGDFQLSAEHVFTGKKDQLQSIVSMARIGYKVAENTTIGAGANMLLLKLDDNYEFQGNFGGYLGMAL